MTHNRKLTASSALVGTALLVGLLAAPAFAAPGNGNGPSDPAASGQSTAPGQEKKATPEPTPAPAQAQGQGADQAQSQPVAAGQAPKAKPTANPGKKDAAPGQTKAPGQSAGNSGTVKVNGQGNSPNISASAGGCAVRVNFYGFNKGTYNVSINAQAPTGNGELLASDTVTISQERIPGSEFQTSITFDLTASLASFEPSAQGYHVKIRVVNPSKPGNGAKQKVTWLDCPRPTPTVAPTTAGGGGGTTPSPTATVRGTRITRPAPPVARGTTITRPGVRVLGVKLTGTLPRTGAPTDAMFWIALALLEWGAIVTVAGRLAARPARSAPVPA
ncbi:MAG: hypothetical protein ABR520_11065 [Mycobacteriales bacterium]|nr:hypothetical protein [Frankia sp.]